MPTVTLTFRIPEEEQEMHQTLQGEHFYSIISEADITYGPSLIP